MDVDAVRLAGGLLRTLRNQLSRQHGGGAERDERAEKAAPRRAAGAARVARIFGVVILRSDAHGTSSFEIPSESILSWRSGDSAAEGA